MSQRLEGDAVVVENVIQAVVVVDLFVVGSSLGSESSFVDIILSVVVKISGDVELSASSVVEISFAVV